MITPSAAWGEGTRRGSLGEPSLTAPLGSGYSPFPEALGSDGQGLSSGGREVALVCLCVRSLLLLQTQEACAFTLLPLYHLLLSHLGTCFARLAA